MRPTQFAPRLRRGANNSFLYVHGMVEEDVADNVAPSSDGPLFVSAATNGVCVSIFAVVRRVLVLRRPMKSTRHGMWLTREKSNFFLFAFRGCCSRCAESKLTVVGCVLDFWKLKFLENRVISLQSDDRKFFSKLMEVIIEYFSV